MNPQSNGIIESVHRSIAVVIRTLVQLYPPTTREEANDLVERAIATAMHATRCAAHSSLNQYSPGGLVFHRDMYFDIPLLADIITLQEARQQGIDKRLIAANAKRIQHEFKVDDLVLKLRKITAADKFRPTYTGPHRIIQVHTNGNVTIRLNQHVLERINIRNIIPYRVAQQ